MLSPLVPQLRPLEPSKINLQTVLAEHGLGVPTGWFPVSIDPVWPGTYEVQLVHSTHSDDGVQMHMVFDPEIKRFRWNGRMWTDELGVVTHLVPFDQWRGVQL